MSNESYASGSETATTTSASDAPDTMSEGARILIEAMKTNPEWFHHGGKYYWAAQALTVSHRHGTGMSRRDNDALSAAHDRYILEPHFTERVVASTLGVDEQEETMRFKAEGRYSFGHTDARALFGILNTNTTT